MIATAAAIALASSVCYGMLYAIREMDNAHYPWDEEDEDDD